MDQYHENINKKVSSGTGGKKGKFRDKKLAHIGRRSRNTKVGPVVRAKLRNRGGSYKVVLKRVDVVNVVTNEGVKQAKILSVLESHRPDLVRENIITKGAILQTSIGKVKVTNRPGQEGMVNGILLQSS